LGRLAGQGFVAEDVVGVKVASLWSARASSKVVLVVGRRRAGGCGEMVHGGVVPRLGGGLL